ncbi:MAG TPA: MBL fold metallo-hydrolase [Acidimicrobiia bacterium]|nr:MBL fold metallo-hydrolase [Acidimicrobiia bacterium]
MDVLHSAAAFAIERIVAGPLDTNVLLVTDRSTLEAIIVDAADDPDAILSMAQGVVVRAVYTTHGHWDHHQAAGRVADALEVPVMIHPADAAMVDHVTTPLSPGTHTIGSMPFTVAHTPGHTPGSVSLVFDGVVITGDTLFPGGPGATRFDHSSFSQIIESIRTELFTLPDATVVIPGHGASTTIGTERPHLRDWVARGW